MSDCLWIVLILTTSAFIYLVRGLDEDLREILYDEFEYDIDDNSSNVILERTFREDVVRKNVVFHYFKNGIKVFKEEGLEANLEETGCLTSDKFAFIIHGWSQDCEEEWIYRLINKLTTHRGGCIVCVDYGYYKNDSYLRILRYFRLINNVLTTKLEQMRTQGFNPKKGFIFGFSLGGQLATAIGRDFSPDYFKQIDTCDMAGPGFDHRRIISHWEAAEQVNCWHTSRNKGTRFYTCHQNIRLGNCGHHQPGENRFISSHGLCTEYYINAFDYPFYAVPQPSRCTSRNPALFLPYNYTVGYSEETKLPAVFGEIFVPTGKQFPYNLPLDKALQYTSLPRGRRHRIPIFIQNARRRILNRL